MITCKDCKHWDTSQAQLPSGWGVCSFVKHQNLTHFVKHGDGSITCEVRPDKQHIKARTQDASDYNSSLLTAPDFYCYHGESKS